MQQRTEHVSMSSVHCCCLQPQSKRSDYKSKDANASLEPIRIHALHERACQAPGRPPKAPLATICTTPLQKRGLPCLGLKSSSPN
jgi:hypothetical protein